MKYLLVWCEDRVPLQFEGAASLLETARLTHVQQLAQAGGIGQVTWSRAHKPVNELQAHWSWLGYPEQEVRPAGRRRRHAPSSWEAGRCYAASAHVDLGEQEHAWCCELVTQHEGRVMDPTAGGISTKEASRLIGSLNEKLATPNRRWVVGERSHHLFITTAAESADVPLNVDIDPPEHLVHRPWRRCLPRQAGSPWLRTLLEDAAELLEDHEVNRVRVDLGENPANMLWAWGTGTNRPLTPFATQTGLSGAVMSRAFAVRGLAHLVGLTWLEGSAKLDESGCERMQRAASKALASHDWLYLHLAIDQTDPIERQCLMQRVSQRLVKPLTDQLTKLEEFRLVVAVDDRSTAMTPFVAVGTQLPNSPAVHFTSQEAAESRLIFHDGAGLFAWLTGAESAAPVSTS